MMKPMRSLAIAVAAQHFLISTVVAWPAITTANVNLRKGPSTNQPILRTVRDGSPIEVEQCDDSGSWCAVTINQVTGFMSGRYLKETDSPRGWPRDYTTAAGAIIRLHQPQITEWQNYESIKGLVAAEYRKDKDAEPAFGVIELGADTYADQDSGEVVAANIKVTNLNFSTLDRGELSDIALRIGQAIPTDPITLSLARVTASLASFQQLQDVEGLKAEAPPIFISQSDAILVQTDGEPVTAPVTNVDGLSFVINTNWDILKIDDTGEWLLRDEKSWLTAKDLKGPWQSAETLPDLLSQLPADDNWKDAREAVPGEPFEDDAVPAVFYSDKPAELIITEGPPARVPVPGTELQWIGNTESDLFFHVGDRNWYFLMSGRWFRAGSLDGPWSFATPDLPSDFRKIPDDTLYYTVRSSVPGTSESDEARLLANIPQMARVETGSVSVDVDYAGEPVFELIDGTAMTYAANASETVIRVGDKYYVVKDGVWFVGDSPEGPFEVATSVPDVVYTIPASSPVHNVTYVRVYETAPGAVWFGYTMGYLWGYLAWNTFVYGSGWYHPPYWYYPPGRYPIYYPRPISYGFGGYYDPARGAFGRYGYAYGPYRGIGVGSRYNPRTGTYVRAGRISGPAGSRGFVSAYNPRTDTRAIARGGSNVYGSWGSAGVKRGSEWARARGFQGDSGAAGLRWQSSTGRQGAVIRGPGNDIYAGRDGNVYRRKDGQWQKYDGGNWSGVQPPDRADLRRVSGDGDRAARRDDVRQRSAQRQDGPRAQDRQRPQTADRRPATQRQGVQRQRSAQTKAQAKRRKAPSNVGNSYRNRQVGNKRSIQQRQVQQRRPQQTRQVQRSRPQRSSPSRQTYRRPSGGGRGGRRR